VGKKEGGASFPSSAIFVFDRVMSSPGGEVAAGGCGHTGPTGFFRLREWRCLSAALRLNVISFPQRKEVPFV
jgi:hypothetical protein